MKSTIKTDGFISRLREAYGGLSVDAIASILGINKQSVYKWGRGETEPELRTLHEISSRTGYSIHWIAFGEGAKKIVDKPIGDELDVEGIKRDAIADYLLNQLRELVNERTVNNESKRAKGEKK